MTSPESIGVIGAGSWGTALASLLANNHHNVKLWARNHEHLLDIATTGTNKRYLDKIPLPSTLDVEFDLKTLVQTQRRFLIVVPSHAFRATLQTLASHLKTDASQSTYDERAVIVWGTKGLEPDSGQLLSDVVSEVFSNNVDYGIISGPSFAKEVALGLPAALTVAANNETVAANIAEWFRNDRTRVYTNDDIAGVQLGGAIKNVMAIATGVSDGLGLGANARAALMTRSLPELTRLGLALGGRPKTFMGLTGVGDLILTCTDDQSRNRRVGLGLGRGQSLVEVLATIGQEAEGITTAKTLHKISARLNVEMPITLQVYRLLYENLSAHDAVNSLLQRQPKAE